MRYLTRDEVLALHAMLLRQSGGAPCVRDEGGLDSALAQPRMGFGDQEFYPTLIEKASALAYSLILNHPFVDGNKRIGHAAMETFLVLNGHELQAEVSEQEQVVLSVAAGTLERDAFTEWVRQHTVERKPGA
jgi:death on curing protein